MVHHTFPYISPVSIFLSFPSVMIEVQLLQTLRDAKFFASIVLDPNDLI